MIISLEQRYGMGTKEAIDNFDIVWYDIDNCPKNFKKWCFLW